MMFRDSLNNVSRTIAIFMISVRYAYFIEWDRFCSHDIIQLYWNTNYLWLAS